MTPSHAWRALLAIALTVAVFSGSALAADGGIRRFAVIIGSNDGGADRVALRYAISDAQAFARVLTQLGGVRASDEVLLEEPDKRSLLAAVAGLGERVGAARADHRRTELVLYYSGHSDEYGLLLGGERLDYKELRAAIDALDADVRIAILDSCASGALLRKKGGARVAPFLLDDSSDVSGHAFLTSSSADEAAQESDRLGASFFTHHLVSGLRGAADVSGDGRVTLNEAYQHAFQETLARTEHTRSGPQHPNYDFDLTGSGDVVITDLSQLSSLLVLSEPLHGRLFIRDAEARLVAEVDKPAGRVVSLGLEPGSYRVSFTDDGFVWARGVTLAAGGQVAVRPEDFEREAPVAAHRDRGDLERPVDEVIVEEVYVDESGYRPTSVTSTRWSLLPMVSFSGPGEGQLVDGFAFGLIGDKVGLVRGLQLTSVFGVVDEAISGGQVGAALNVSGGWVDGAQVTGGLNLARGSVTGAQVAGGANVSGDWVHGAQVSGGANIAGGAVRGAQVAGGVNVAGDWVDGVQVAGGVNVAGDVDGAQIAGGVNIADRVTGLQISILNIASEVKGTQIGVINVAGKVDGASIALLPIVGEGGYNHLEAWGDSSIPFNVGLRLGTPVFHWLLSVGVSDAALGDRCVMRLGGGFGTHIDTGPLYLDIDLTAHGLLGKGCDIDHFADDEILTQARVTLGLPITEALAVYVGVAANGEVRLEDNDIVRPLLVDDGDSFDESWQARIFPSFFAGVRLF